MNQYRITEKSPGKSGITVILPAFNEERTIEEIVRRAKKYTEDVLVIDDGSRDETVKNALKSGARVISHRKNMGYIAALRTGFRHAEGDIIVVMDADGQHDPDDIPPLVKPILEGEADLVIGARKHLSFSEKILTRLTSIKVKTRDASSGFKAIRKEIAKRMQIRGTCVCGTFVLEAAKLGARITDVKIKYERRRFGRSRIKRHHFIQFFLVLKELIF